MSDNWILPRTYTLVAQMEALKVRSLGMKSTNDACIANSQAPAYSDSNFEEVAMEIFAISEELRNVIPQ